MGAVTTMLISFILPTLFYLIVRWHSLSYPVLIGCFSILLVGVIGMYLGLQTTLSRG